MSSAGWMLLICSLIGVWSLAGFCYYKLLFEDNKLIFENDGSGSDMTTPKKPKAAAPKKEEPPEEKPSQEEDDDSVEEASSEEEK